MVPGRDILPETSVLFVCDVQDKFRPHASNFEALVEVIRRMVESANLLQIPIIVTEQYPKGLGSTVHELNLEHAKKFEKSYFSMIVPDVEKYLENSCKNRKHAIVCGIEAHVCVLQTCLDLLAKGYEVYLLADGCSSRSQTDRTFALRRLEKAGCIVTTYESLVLQLIRHKDHPQFKAIQGLIKILPPDSGLILNKL